MGARVEELSWLAPRCRSKLNNFETAFLFFLWRVKLHPFFLIPAFPKLPLLCVNLEIVIGKTIIDVMFYRMLIIFTGGYNFEFWMRKKKKSKTTRCVLVRCQFFFFFLSFEFYLLNRSFIFLALIKLIISSVLFFMT